MRIECFGEILKNRLPEKIETSANQKRGRASFDTASSFYL